jgi:hypothetical protein
MKFEFYLELATRVTGLGLLDFIRFPASQAHLRGEWFARWWSRGKTKRMHSSDREKIIDRIGGDQFNELSLKWRPLGTPSLVEFVKIESVSITFYPSPFSELWAEVPIHRLKSHAENRARMNFRNVESALTRAHAVPFPSTLECFFNLETPGESLSDSKLQALSLGWLRAVIPESMLGQDFFGYGCVHGTCRRMLMCMSLGFPEIDQLGSEFENIYPLLIGPRSSCQGLASALGCGLVIPISDQAPSAILSIEPDEIESARGNTAAKNWLVARPPVPDKLGPRAFVVPPKP